MELQGQVQALYLGDAKGLEKTACTTLEFTLEGIVGDKHAGFTKKADARNPEYKRRTLMRNDRQWSAVAPDELAEAARLMGVDTIEAGWVGANLAFTGIPDFTLLPKGTRLIFPSGAMHKRGLVGVIERAGIVRVGDAVTVQVYEAAEYPLSVG